MSKTEWKPKVFTNPLSLLGCGTDVTNSWHVSLSFRLLTANLIVIEEKED